MALLSKIIGIDSLSFLEKVIKNNIGLNKFRPITIQKYIDFEKKIALEERIEEFPGIIFSTIPARKYVSRVSLSHVLGYLRIVDKDRQSSLNHKDSLYRYSIGDVYGFSGIEKVYESNLRGKNGVEYRLVDNRGVDQGEFDQRDRIEVINGPSIRTTINLELQSIAEKSLSGKSGSIICMDPKNGEILAFASSPDYDLKPFIGPVDQNQWDNWNNDKKTPLLNRIISGEYPPGSVFKLVTAALLLKEKKEKIQYHCSGEHELSVTEEGVSEFKKCWNPLGHGEIDLAEALEVSCNVYFYKAIKDITFEDLDLMSREFNFGNKIGIDLIGEKKGIIPNPKYMRKKYEYRDINGKRVVDWARHGTKANMGIGQGDVLATPLQVVNLINIIANKGLSYKPHLVTNSNNNIATKVDLDISIWKFLNMAMWNAVNAKNGTGRNARIDDSSAYIRGKTGTAQNPHGEDHSWFAGYIVAKNLNKLSIVVMIENGGRGSGVSSEIAKNMFSYFSSTNKE